MFVIVWLYGSMDHGLLGRTDCGLGRISTAIFPVYGSCRNEGVEGRELEASLLEKLPKDDPGRERFDGCRGEAGRKVLDGGRSSLLMSDLGGLDSTGVVLPLEIVDLVRMGVR